MILSAVVLVLAGILYVRWLWSRREWYRMSWRMPGPIGLPFIGSAYHLLTKGTSIYATSQRLLSFQIFVFTESLDFVEEVSLRYEHLQSPISVWLGTQLFVYVDSLHAVETVLTSTDCLDRQESYKYIRQGLGVDGIFTLNGPKWKLHRRLVSPSFNYNVVLSYLPVFNANCRHLMDGLQLKVGAEAFNVRDVLVPTMLNLFLEATFGSNLSAEDKQRFRKYITE